MQESGHVQGITEGSIHSTDLHGPPARKLAILTCMDARIDIDALFDLKLGDAHVMRNAGGIATSDVIRSLAASQRLLGTEEIVVIQHTDCGVHNMAPEDFVDLIERETGVRPDWDAQTTGEPQTTLTLSLDRLRSSPELLHRDRITGHVLDLKSGKLLNPA
jgi:carbonic anhydrase